MFRTDLILYSQLEERAGYARRGEKQIPEIY